MNQQEKKEYSDTVADELIGWTCEVRHSREEDELLYKAIEIIRSYGTKV